MSIPRSKVYTILSDDLNEAALLLLGTERLGERYLGSGM